MVDFTRTNFLPTINELSKTLALRGTRQYFMMFPYNTTVWRGYDTGLNQFVTWLVNTASPPSSATTPNYTGTLIDVHIEIP